MKSTFIHPGLLHVLVMSVLCGIASRLPAESKGPWDAIVVGSQGDCEHLATVDLQRYLGQVTGVTPVLMNVEQWQISPRPAIILGTARGNPVIGRVVTDAARLGDQGYRLANASVGGVQVVLAAGATPEAATNAVYGLLRELGYGFYLGSEAVPDSLPARLPKSPITRKPVFSVRGVLPWYNFFNSPTTWDPVDHRAFVDQLIRSGANFVGFHTYDHEPFAAFEENGKMVWGGRLLSTASPTWGTHPMPTTNFGFGTDKLYADDYFGAETTKIADGDAAIRAEQEIMRDALDYAKKRGLNTCLGFEMWGDPLDPKDRDAFLKRINHLLDHYPSLDYIWVWQAETQGAQGFTEKPNSMHHLPYTLKPESRLPFYGAVRRDVFRRIVQESKGDPSFFQDNADGERARANEGARLEQFAQLALHAMSHRKNPPKLVISGWGGDQRILSAEYYEGLDRLLPKSVVFSSLDHIVPRDRVDKVYGALSKDRQRWPIPWLEYDGDQWHQQPYVHTFEKLARDARERGCQGILGIHWRTRELEENFQYLMDYSWNPGLTADAFFKDYANRCYGSDIAEQMARIHSDLDQLGYRWVGGSGQAECAPFDWGPGTEENVKRLQALHDEAASLLPKSGKGKARLEWLIANMDWTLKFQRAEQDAVAARHLLVKARGASGEEASKLADEALSILEGGSLGTALRAYANRLSTRGEYGVLATINTKAFAAWESLRKEALAIAGKNEVAHKDAEWHAEPRILLPRLLGSVEEGTPLELLPVVLGGGRAWVHYRPIGSQRWYTRELEQRRGWVQHTVLPGRAVAQPGLELGFSFNRNPGAPMAYGPVALTVMPGMKTATQALPARQSGRLKDLHVSIREADAVPLLLSWEDVPDADYFRVMRNGKLLVETAVPMCPDAPEHPTGEYCVQAMRNGKVLCESKPIKYTKPDWHMGEQPDLKARVLRSCILLEWPATKSARVVSYKITRVPAAGNGKEDIIGNIGASHANSHILRDMPDAGKWIYKVTPIGFGGDEGSPTSTTVDFAPQIDDAAAAVSIPLTSAPEGGQVTGKVKFGPDGASFGDGHIELAHSDVFNLRQGMTLTFEFRADDVRGMPVLLSHGCFMADGWFAQILGGMLIIRTPQGDARGPRVEVGKWHKVQFVYDGAHLSLVVDGKWIQQTGGAVRDVPANRHLVIGNYEVRGPEFQFHGTIRNVKFYDHPIL